MCSCASLIFPIALSFGNVVIGYQINSFFLNIKILVVHQTSQHCASSASFQDHFFLWRSLTFQLRNLIVALMFERGSQAFEQLRPADDSLGAADMFAEIVCKCAVVASRNIGIRRRLVVFAS